jgi:hypothetical protein
VIRDEIMREASRLVLRLLPPPVLEVKTMHDAVIRNYKNPINVGCRYVCRRSVPSAQIGLSRDGT